ncbi:uncharacterized protein ISCGN_025427 [Ixodes scapularis]
MSKPSTPPMPPLPSELLPPPKPLDTSGDAWLGWKNWKREFALFSTATQLSKQPEEVQAATLLITIGEEARKAYDTFKFTTDEERNSVEVLIQKFEARYKPATNLTFQEFRFGSRDQKEGEPFNEWLTELRILAKNCEFGELEDRMLRSRIILGVRDKSVQRKLLVGNPTYEKTVELCRLQEQGQEKFREITGTAQGAPEATINAVAAKKSPCSRCGYFAHRGETCPAKGKTCEKCGRLNHFAQVCKTPVLQQSANKPKKELRALHTESDEEFFLEALTVNWVATDKWSAAHEELFFVVEQHVPITLSGSVAERLGLLYRVQNVHLENLYQAAQPFAEVFKGLAQLKDVEYEMKLKPGTVGVVVPARRVPVALQDKVKAELQRMEERGVITKTEARYLGHILTTQGLRLDPDRANDILAMPPPSNSKGLQVFLGTMNFVQRFVPRMSDVTAPLRALLRKDVAWVWTEQQRRAKTSIDRSTGSVVL